MGLGNPPAERASREQFTHTCPPLREPRRGNPAQTFRLVTVQSHTGSYRLISLGSNLPPFPEGSMKDPPFTPKVLGQPRRAADLEASGMVCGGACVFQKRSPALHRNGYLPNPFTNACSTFSLHANFEVTSPFLPVVPHPCLLPPVVNIEDGSLTTPILARAPNPFPVSASTGKTGSPPPLRSTPGGGVIQPSESHLSLISD